jgi:tetratricopeptide (TPR) repeat protein
MGAKTYAGTLDSWPPALDRALLFSSDVQAMWLARLILLIFISVFLPSCKKAKTEDDFIRLTNVGKNYYESGQATKALAPLQQALAKNPANADAHLNVAVAALAADQPELAVKHAQEVLNLDRSSGGAYYVLGSAQLRLGRAKEAIQALQQAKDIDRTVNAVSFQLGRAYQQLNQFEEAREQFAEVTQFETNHPAAYYNLSQVLIRLGQTDEAQKALAEHQKITAGRAGQITDPSVFERCQHTQIRAPFRLEQPDPRGIQVAFTDVTKTAFGQTASQWRGPFGVLDFNHDGKPSLFVMESNSFRVLFNSNGVLSPAPAGLPGMPGANYFTCIVGDLNNDKVEDAIFVGDKGSHVFRFATNGTAVDQGTFSRLASVTATRGVLIDLDFTGKLDLLAITGASNGVKVLRNLGHPYFSDNTTNSGVPLTLTGAQQLLVEDWNNDDLLDLFILRSNQPPLLLVKERGGPLVETNLTADWPVASAMAAGDLNNDLRFDLALASGDKIVCIFNQLKERQTISIGNMQIRELRMVDYDNDGWLDIAAAGSGIRIWRNLGNSGFKEVPLGLEKLGSATSFKSFDVDGDCDSDLIVALEGGGMRCLRNDGGNANAQLKPQLIGTKSNASGLGIRVDVAASGLRITRRVQELPVEIGVGRHQQLDSVTAHWFDVNLNYTDVKVDCRMLLALDELALPTGSCPYLYAWDGKCFRFVTDLLGAAPAGLPISETRFIDADPDEYVWIGDEAMFPPRDGHHLVQITEELREVLYLDEAKLVVVDHPPGTEVHTTGKLLPGPPFPKHELVTLHNPRPLLNAVNRAGEDVTTRLQEADGEMVSPAKLRIPQLRGLAEPHSVTLDFGPLPVEKPLVLAITAWLRFGGGMANIAASHNPDLPFPFPGLEAEVGNKWKGVQVNFGAPVGKTKRMIVDLSGKLPEDARRLRITTAFEIHWDRIALFEKRDNSETRITFLPPTKADLHWRGFSEYEDLSWHRPLRPAYGNVTSHAKWTITPAGWCTRYGPVDELIAERDNALALLNGGDELTLAFPTSQVPPKQGMRDFFLYSVGWDKDADFHCTRGWEVEPLPWHGMDSQKYGREPRPAFPSDTLIKKYNTRWVGPYTLTRK